VIPATEFDRSRPVTSITDTNDGYYLILDTESIGRELDPVYDDGYSRSGPAYIVSKHNNLLDFLKNELGLNTEEAAEWLNTDPDKNEMNVGVGVLKVKKITGVYTDPEILFDTFYASDDEDE
jgi:hypothetical protein